MTTSMHPFKLMLLLAFLVVSTSLQVSAQEYLKDHTPDGFAIGGVIQGGSEAANTAQYRNVATNEFNALTSTAYLPWGVWDNPRKRPDTRAFESIVDLAIQNRMRVHGHVLCYPEANQSSKWWPDLKDSKVPIGIKKYIDAVAGCRRGKIWVWDVVNEVMAADEHKMDSYGLRTDYKEYRAMGPAYVAKAFQWAKAADPAAKLILNDYDIATVNSKSDRLLKLARVLKARGVPIDGIGFQMHFKDINQAKPDVASIEKNFQRFADAGFEIYITEFDVPSIHAFEPSPSQPGVTVPSEAQQKRQALFFREVLSLALRQPACKSFLMWDFADDFSWLHKTERQISNIPKGAFTYPAPFWCGKNGPASPKMAYFGMIKALKTTPQVNR